MRAVKALRPSRCRYSALLLAVTLVVLGASAVAHGATVTVISYDGPGEGFNDPTPVVPVGGNPGTTLGAQRLNAFQHAGSIWGALLDSPVAIRVGARFDPMTCSATSTILGSAGPVSVVRDFVGAPLANTWFSVALANSIFGTDLIPQNDDIGATFNSALGTTCAFPYPWYYGLDGSPPGNQIDFVTVVIHELGHGLGFLTLVDLGSGSKLGGFDDSFMKHLEDHTTGKLYPSMTNAERVTASKNTGNLHWVGPEVAAASGVLTAGRVGTHVRMFAPNPPQGGSSVSHFDTVLTPNEPMEPSYTVPRHTVGLTLPVLHDIGWQAGSGDISVDPLSINFGGVLVGTLVPQMVTVSNAGSAVLTVGQLTVGGANADQFRLPAPLDFCSGAVLAPGASCTAKVRAKPTQSGSFSATLVIPSNDPGQSIVTVALSATGLAPHITLIPSAIGFGTVSVGQLLGQTVAVLNSGSADLAIGLITLGGPSPDQYRLPAPLDLCSGTTLSPGATCTVKVRFKPTIVGAWSATLLVPSTALGEPLATVSLDGTGTP